MNVLEDIVQARLQRIAARGHDQGVQLPPERTAPHAPFLSADGVVMEMKRASPSRGAIAGFDPALKAREYRAMSARNISVLTEEDRFKGSLRDLMVAKAACPELAFLRKDFLLDEEDVRVSHRAGADAVLLIAAILEQSLLSRLIGLARELGMEALVEIHDAQDLAKARASGARLLGINSRDLKTFRIDPLLPLSLKHFIDWEARVVYESGIMHPAEASLAAMSGFHGILVGEAVSRDPSAGQAISAAFRSAPRRRFWDRISRPAPAPLVKVCGIARIEDAECAELAGADILGFVLAPSPRRTTASLIRELGPLGAALRVAVITDPPDRVDAEVLSLVEEGYLDALQFHGESEGAAFRAALAASPIPEKGIPFYKALRQAATPVPAAAEYACPRLLVDAWSAQAAGGTGKRLNEEILEALGPCAWIAGGLDPTNVADIVERRRPALVDASSGLESEPGRKDHDKVRTFIKEAKGEQHGSGKAPREGSLRPLRRDICR